MDSATQFLMGSAIGQIVIGPKRNGKGALIGGIAGTLPDLDIIPLIGTSVITQLTYHRSVTHSLLFCMAISVILAAICRYWIKGSIKLNRWFLFWILAFLTHIGLDLMTTWGTQILWPNTSRFSLNSLFIIDPLVTLPLLVGCCWSTLKRQSKPALIGVICLFVYSFFALSTHYYMNNKFMTALNHNNIDIKSLLVRPTPFNTLYWGMTARLPNNTLVMGYARIWDPYQSITFSTPIHQGKYFLEDSIKRKDIEQLLSITKGYYIIKENKDKIIIHDARFGRIGGWITDSNDQFIFNYILDIDKNQWSQYRPEIPDPLGMIKVLFRQIITR